MSELIEQLDDALDELGSRPGNLAHLHAVSEAMTELERLRAIEAAAREVVDEFSMPSELDGAEQAALDKLRLALSRGPTRE